MALRSFVLGAAVAYGVQYITKKRTDGSSILSDFMENPPEIVKDAQDYVADIVEDVTHATKQKMQF